MKRLITLALISLFLGGCASKYELLNPEQAYYQSINKENGIEVSYKYNPLRKKYRKYAEQNNIRVVSIKIKNSTERNLVLGTDFILKSYEENTLNILSPKETVAIVKQKPATHLWYLLLTPTNIYKQETSQNGAFTEQKSVFPIGLILGPALTLANMTTASKANKTFLQELETENLINKTIKKGETVYGLISILQNDYPSIKASLIK